MGEKFHGLDLLDKADSYPGIRGCLVFMIGLIYAINGLECPLATAVHRLAGRRDVADIFSPDWFANKIMPVSTGAYIVGAMLVARQVYRNRKSSKKPQDKL